MTTELAPADFESNAAAATLAVIERAASDPTVDIDKMERLLQMQTRILDKSARDQFTQALAAFQRDCPTIKKTRRAHTTNYAPYDHLMTIIRPFLTDHGFALSFDSETLSDQVRVVCTLSHRAGHSITTSFTAAIDKSGSKNAVQAVGSSLSYGKRYSVCAALNIITTDEDDDGAALGAAVIPTVSCALASPSKESESFVLARSIKEQIENAKVSFSSFGRWLQENDWPGGKLGDWNIADLKRLQDVMGTVITDLKGDDA